MSNHLLFMFTLGGLCLGFAKYEFTKYYYYLKYRRLVTGYLESCEQTYLTTLNEMGKAI